LGSVEKAEGHRGGGGSAIGARAPMRILPSARSLARPRRIWPSLNVYPFGIDRLAYEPVIAATMFRAYDAGYHHRGMSAVGRQIQPVLKC